MSGHRYIACDLGAESGRVMLGTLGDDGRLALAEAHRFPTPTVRVDAAVPSLRWDVSRLWAEIVAGLSAAGPADSVGVDSWGVDYVLLAGGRPVADPHHYRDGRTADPYRAVRDRLGEPFIFEQTGVQFMPINTLYQLAAEPADAVARADGFVTIADHFNGRLSGVVAVDESMASTTQLYDPRTRQWAWPLVDRFGLPRRLFPRIVPPGTVLGPMLPTVAAEVAFAAAPAVIATCSHDTAAAVAAVPAMSGDDWAYLSSGTWSLLGVELPTPLVNDAVRRANFTNEAGFGGTTRFLKNIVGLWLLQELRRAWAAAGRDYDYAALNELARSAEPFRAVIDAADPRFATPGDMPAKVAGYCRETGQSAPESPGQFARCVLESLALLYRSTLEQLERLTGRTVRRLHVVGGGSRSELLNQFTANATGRTVVAGPVEATAIGNVVVQAIALGHVPSLSAARRIVRDSFPVTTFQPTAAPAWQRAYERFGQLINA